MRETVRLLIVTIIFHESEGFGNKKNRVSFANFVTYLLNFITSVKCTDRGEIIQYIVSHFISTKA